jgi:hypothetical protein
LTFSSALAAGGRVIVYYDNITADYRQNQRLTIDSLEDGDYWPPPSLSQDAPVSTAAQKYDGRPLSLSAPNIEYEGLKDIIVESALADFRFYDDTYLYNNTFYYDSEQRFNNDLFAINLRRLDFTVTPRA